MTSATGAAAPISWINWGLNHATNGAIRIPTFLLAASTAMMAGELTLRGLGSILTAANRGPPAPDGGVASLVETIRGTPIRVFGKLDRNGNYEIPTSTLAAKFLISAGLTIAAGEAATFLCGPAPAIYNHVLTLIGPVRVDSTPWLEGASRVLSKYSGYLPL